MAASTTRPCFQPCWPRSNAAGLTLQDASLTVTRGTILTTTARLIFEMGMTPNIKQRKNAISRGKPHRKKAAGLFDGEEYKERSMIEGVFGAEETRRHQLHCRFIRDDNRRRFAKGRATSGNVLVPNLV